MELAFTCIAAALSRSIFTLICGLVMATLLVTSSTPGTFVISLDQELIWGSFDHTAPDAFLAAYPEAALWQDSGGRLQHWGLGGPVATEQGFLRALERLWREQQTAPARLNPLCRDQS